MAKLSPQARARKIKLLLFDVDGVLTDGKLFFLPAPAGAQPSMIEFKGFHAHDGASISLARLGGIKTGLITKRISETVTILSSNTCIRECRISAGVSKEL
jgi:3-deoxy-D-manno-octulosonate 8-phosphate phosphatase (KDO 8-P phosphatase)